MHHEPIHVTFPGSPEDPRSAAPPPRPPGVVVHHVPELHPDDVCVVDGIPVTSPARTLIDLAEVADPDELRECFGRALELGLVDAQALRAARGRVEWRPSLPLFDEVVEELGLE